MAIRRRARRQQSRAQQKKHRINAQIWATELRVVGEDGEDLGTLSSREALELAKAKKLDLVEVAPNAKPPVAKIMNYGKFMFEQEKREREARKKQKATSLKEVKLRPKIGDHDREFKIGKGIEFLQFGHKLKVTVMFSGREMAHTEIGRALLDEVKVDLLEHGKIESPPRLEGRNLSMTIAPLAAAKKAALDRTIERTAKREERVVDDSDDEEVDDTELDDTESDDTGSGETESDEDQSSDTEDTTSTEAEAEPEKGEDSEEVETKSTEEEPDTGDSDDAEEPAAKAKG